MSFCAQHRPGWNINVVRNTLLLSLSKLTGSTLDRAVQSLWGLDGALKAQSWSGLMCSGKKGNKGRLLWDTQESNWWYLFLVFRMEKERFQLFVSSMILHGRWKAKTIEMWFVVSDKKMWAWIYQRNTIIEEKNTDCR